MKNIHSFQKKSATIIGEENVLEYYNTAGVEVVSPNTYINLSPLVAFDYFPAIDQLSPLQQGSFPLLTTPPAPIAYQMTLQENDYFDYFYNHVCPRFSIVPHKINSFLQAILNLSLTDLAVLQCLIGWGQIMKDRHVANKRIEGNSCTSGSKFAKKLLQILASRDSSNPQELILFMFCYAILMCIEISAGDTNEWSWYLTHSYDLLNSMGGFKVLSNYSHEGKILAQNFAYFDILASQSNENGTYYPVEQYCDVFYMDGAEFIDPMQGCIRPLVLILGDVINLIVEARDVFLEEITDLNWHTVNSILTKVKDIEHELEIALIHPSDYNVLAENDVIENHFTMFALYQMVILLYIKHSLRRLPPVVPDIQLILRKVYECLDTLIDTPLALSLSFPLLIAGISSVLQSDRDEVLRKINYLVSKNELDNLRKVEVVLEEVWKRNDRGTLCVDWFKITKSFGWRLNAGR